MAIGLIGTVVGALGAGVVGQKLGGRETLRITAVLYVVSAVGCGLAWSWPSFMVFRFIGGLGIGASSVLGPVYIAELAPAKWRGRLVSAFQFNVVFGILVAYTSNYVIRLHAPGRGGVALAGGHRRDSGRRLSGAALRHSPQPALVGVAGIAIDEALAVLKLMGEPEPEAELADIRIGAGRRSTPRPTSRSSAGSTAIRLFLAISIGAFNQLAGINAILYYLNNIFAAAGFSQISSDQQAIAIGATNFFSRWWACR